MLRFERQWLLAPERPTDRRSRAVLSVEAAGRAGTLLLTLECGHTARRRPAICVPRRILCRDC